MEKKISHQFQHMFWMVLLSTHNIMFWLRNKKIIFLVHTLNYRPGLTYSLLLVACRRTFVVMPIIKCFYESSGKTDPSEVEKQNFVLLSLFMIIHGKCKFPCSSHILLSVRT